MGGFEHDARESRDRCLAAIPGADFETAVALWRAAKRYNERRDGPLPRSEAKAGVRVA